jgi:dihydroorotate dehydrogenase
MVCAGIGAAIIILGLTIMFVGLHDVLIPPDRAFMGNSQGFFKTQLNGRLLRFVAHNHAGFGGALFSLGVGILATALWGLA